MPYADKLSLIRHYPYVKNAAQAEFERLILKKRFPWISETEQARINELERELELQTFEELAEEIRGKISRCLDKDNKFLFCYEPDWTKREVDTAMDLISRFEIPEEKILEIQMPWPTKGHWVNYSSEYRRKVNAILSHASKKDAFVREAVLVWRRSDSYSFLNYAPGESIEAWRARKLLEEEAVISIETTWKLYAWVPYWNIVSMMEKHVNKRHFQKIIKSGGIHVNGTSYNQPHRYPGLYEWDIVRYKNRLIAVTVAEDWTTVLTKIPGNGSE